MKPLLWLGDSLERVRGFPVLAKQRVGYQLERVQAGAGPPGWISRSQRGDIGR